MEAVIQGPIYKDTVKIIQEYLNTSFINRVIISCWDTCELPEIKNEKVLFIQNSHPEIAGNNKRNYHIKSSKNGIAQVKEKHCLKSRTDYFIKTEDLEKIYRFFLKFKNPQLKYLNGDGPETQMFCFGDVTYFPFHPKDQFYISDKDSLEKLFDIPFCPRSPHPTGSNYDYMPPEIYIAIHYYARFNSEAKHMLDNYKEYLCENSPKRAEAFKLSKKLEDKVFKTLPKTDAFIMKPNYYYYWPISDLERWHTDKWE